MAAIFPGSDQGVLRRNDEHHREVEWTARKIPQPASRKIQSVYALFITDHLFERPVLSITEASKICGTSYQSAKKNVDQLVRLGILQQVRGYENPKLFWAKEIIDISDGR